MDARDGTMRVRDGVVHRLVTVDGRHTLVRAWRTPDERITLRAEPVRLIHSVASAAPTEPADRSDLETAIERMRLALGIDDDLRPFYERFKRDRLLGPIIRAKPWVRPRRRPWPWEALAWAVTEQLIESGRAAGIQRAILRRIGPRLGPPGRQGLRDVPGAETFAGLAPAELASHDLAPARALTMVKVAHEVATGRAPLEELDRVEARLRSISGIGPWTVEMLALKGLGRFDRLPAGDLAYIKLIGTLCRLGRRATVEEVHEFFAPYEPYKGLAGVFVLHGSRQLAAAA
jgi:3-methyladenine DNA glycosylase/8-oxoguanine DNA glycosylase